MDLSLDDTFHAKGQRQRRAGLPLIEALILDYGMRIRRHGADVVYLDKAARKQIRREVGGDRSLRVVERWLNTYLVVGDNGQIITNARRTRRIRRP